VYRVCRAVLCLVSDGDEVLAELLRDGGGLLGDDGVLVQADDQSLRGLDGVHSRRALPRPNDLFIRREEHVTNAADGDAAHGHLLGVAVLGQEDLKLVNGHVESCAGGPDVSVVPADDCLLDHAGRDQLIVHVRLPRHGVSVVG